MFQAIHHAPTPFAAIQVNQCVILSLLMLAAGCSELPTELRETGYESFTPTAPQECEPTGDIGFGETRSGRLEEQDCTSYPDQWFDRWTLTLDRSADVRIDMNSGAFDTMLELLDATGYSIAFNDDAPGTLDSRIVASLDPGTYGVIATSFAPGMLGGYELSVEEAQGCGEGTEIVLGEELGGEITGDCLLDEWAPADSLLLTLPEDARLDFTVKSTDFPPRIIVRDERRWDVFVGIDETGSGMARGQATLGAGSYTVYVATGGLERGAYKLLVEEVACDEARPISVGETVQGTLDHDDCVRTGGAFRDSWALDLEAEGTVRIDLESADFDAWVSVIDEGGHEIALDDDSGSGFDASLTVTLPAGRYHILASSFGPGATGAYLLTVAEETVAAAAVADLR